MVYNALWQMVERNQKILNLVPKNNRIRFDEQNSQKAQLASADTPELALMPNGGIWNGKNNSSKTSVTKNYTWAITTGDLRLNPLYNRLSWELFRSLTDWECILCPLEWCECQFVMNFRLIQTEEGTIMQDIDKGIPGWSALWTCELDLAFETSKLRLIGPGLNS